MFFSFFSVRRLIEGKEYQFRVLAENLYGTSDPCEESDSVLIQEAKIDIDYDKLGTCLLFAQFFQLHSKFSEITFVQLV